MPEHDPIGRTLDALGVENATVLVKLNEDGSAVVVSEEGAFDIPASDIDVT
jgi:hypothetical protein